MNSTILDNTINILLIQFTKLSLKMIQSCNNTPNQSVGNNFHNLFPFLFSKFLPTKIEFYLFNSAHVFSGLCKNLICNHTCPNLLK